jgi:hypothetical protein
MMKNPSSEPFFKGAKIGHSERSIKRLPIKKVRQGSFYSTSSLSKGEGTQKFPITSSNLNAFQARGPLHKSYLYARNFR